MTEDEQKSYYVWVEPSKIPNLWSNDPESLEVYDYFCPTEEETCIISEFQEMFGLPNPRPILYKASENHFLLDGGNG